jgi:FkbM family methyltransferase
VDRYATKRKLLRPLTAIRRRKRYPNASPYARSVYEAHDYRPSMRRFFLDTRDDPDILIDFDLPAGAVVIDVGAYIGEWSERIIGRADDRGQEGLQIHAFEPEPHAYERLLEGIAQDPRVHPHPVGLSGRQRVEQLSIGGPGSSVFVDPAAPGFLGATEIELRDADAELTALGLDRIDLLKVNIEGGEFELLDRLHETGWLARTRTVIVQFHEFGPDAYRGRRRNRRQLAETHACTWSYTWVWERWDAR